MTQEALAATSGVSVDVVKRLERGAQASARLVTIRQLGDALDVSLSELTGRRPRVSQPGDLALQIRDALYADRLPGLPPRSESEAHETLPVAVLQREVDAAWALYAGGQFERLATHLPALLADVRRPVAGLDSEVVTVRAQALQITAQLLVHLGREDLAVAAAERAVTVAAAGDDRATWAAAGSAVAWVHHAGFARPATAAALAIEVADEIRPPTDHAPGDELFVWGVLLLTALAAAGAAGDSDLVGELLPTAQDAARRVGRDESRRGLEFGPSALGLQVVYSSLGLDRPDAAVSAAAGIDLAAVRPVSNARHHVDLAQALVQLRRPEDALEALARAQVVAPAWFHATTHVRLLLEEIALSQARMSSQLRRLMRSTTPLTSPSPAPGV